MGEIYAIAVDPDFPGLGLGTALTVAGLEHLAGRGLTVGMLYVDGGNTGAVTMYEQLGFTIHHTDRAYLGHVEAAHVTGDRRLPRWDVTDVHESFTARSFVDATGAHRGRRRPAGRPVRRARRRLDRAAAGRPRPTAPPPTR